MDFGKALVLLRAGERVTRRAWEKSTFIYLVPAASYPAQRGAAKRWLGEEAVVPYEEYIAKLTETGTVVPWTVRQEDALADDWASAEDKSLSVYLPNQIKGMAEQNRFESRMGVIKAMATLNATMTGLGFKKLQVRVEPEDVVRLAHVCEPEDVLLVADTFGMQFSFAGVSVSCRPARPGEGVMTGPLTGGLNV